MKTVRAYPNAHISGVDFVFLPVNAVSDGNRRVASDKAARSI